MDLAYVLVVDFVYLLGLEKKFYCMYEVVAIFLCDILGYMVQKCLVVNNHHQMRNNSYDEVLAFYFYFVERMDNFHYDPVEDVNEFENLLSWLLSLGYPNSENIHDY